MFSHFLPKNKSFFEIFNQYAVEIQAAATLLRQGFQQEIPITDIPRLRRERKDVVNRLRKQLFTLSHKTFVTPFDRNDIHRLNKELYRGCSTALAVLARFMVYDIKDVPEAMHKMTLVCEMAAGSVMNLVKDIENLANAPEIIESCLKIKRYESEADSLLLQGLDDLFKTENDFKRLLKCREIYDALEKITDYYLQIAFVIEGIVLEYT